MRPSDWLRARLQVRHRPQRHAWLADLLQAQILHPAALHAMQQQRLQALLRHAVAEVPYYRQRFAGLDLARPEQLPTLHKAEVRAHRDALLADSADRTQARIGHTSGSSGQPLSFWYDTEKHERMRAGMLRGFMLTGWQPGEKVLYFWGAAHDMAKGGIFGGTAWQTWLAGERTLTANRYGETELAAWAHTLHTYRPRLLYGYPSAMSALARFMLDTRQAPPRSLAGVISTAETLTATQRDTMQQAFACQVFNQYGCREVPNIAWECRHGSLHVMSDLVWLESDPADDSLRVTALSNRQMPFIRYALGDHGRLLDAPGEAGCACGLPFPRMAMDIGRQNDVIRLPDGTRLQPGVFNRLLDGERWLLEYQWVQTGPQALTLRFVAASPAPSDFAGQLEQRLGVAAPGLVLTIEAVNELQRGDNGKHRYVLAWPG